MALGSILAYTLTVFSKLSGGKDSDAMARAIIEMPPNFRTQG